MQRKNNILFLIFFIGMVAASIGLILQLPSLTDPGSSVELWIPGVLGFLALALGLAASNVRRATVATT